jgi:PAS domain S-box-containing protein
MVTSIIGKGYEEIFSNSPVAMLILATDSPSYTIIDVNDAYLHSTNSTRETLMGNSVFGVFPANPTDEVSKNIERTIFSFEQAIKTKQPHTMSNYRYDIPVRGTNEFEERYWTTTNIPLLDNNGDVKFFIHTPQNVTELYKAGEREKAGIKALKNQRQQLYSIFMQAPVGIGIFRGPQYIVELVNTPLCELYGKTVDEMLNKPVFDVLTYAKGIGFEELLDNVRLTGIPYKGQGLAIPILRNNVLQTIFVNFVYEPFREADGTISGVIVVATEITEQVNAKQKSEEAEERARLAVDAVGLGTYDLNLETSEMITSKTFANIFGFDQPVPRNMYLSVFHPDDVSMRTLAHKDAVETGNLYYEARVIWKDKSVHWVRVEGKVFYNAEGDAVRIIGTLLDTTSQKKGKEEQQKLLTLVANSVDLMTVLNIDGVNSYINEAGRKMLGFESDEEVFQVPISALYAPEDYEFVAREVIPTVMKKGNWIGTMMVRHLHTKEIFPVHNNCIRIDDPSTGKPMAIGAVMRDLRPELKAKQALTDSEQLLRNITTAAPTGLWMADENGLITYINQTWIDWTGLSFEEHLGAGWLRAIINEDREKAAHKFSHDIAERNSFEVDFRIHHVDGTMHWCSANGRPQYKSDGSFAGYIGACVDITEQKYLQQQKDDFIGIASHELKTPVTSIKAYAQVLERMMIKNGATKEAAMISKMDNQLNRLTSLIADLLDVTKINSGKLQFNDVEFDFNDYVKILIEELQHTTLKHTLVEKLSPAGIVFGDKERIGQVITNLVTNAIKYSPNSTEIIIHSSIENNEVVLCVEDFGIGISEKNLKRVFEQFYRVSGDLQHTFPGLGLGLYISSEIIKREGGRIWVNSVQGQGSTFCFALPLKNKI